MTPNEQDIIRLQLLMDLMDKNNCYELQVGEIKICKKPFDKTTLIEKQPEEEAKSIFDDPDFYAGVPSYVPPK